MLRPRLAGFTSGTVELHELPQKYDYLLKISFRYSGFRPRSLKDFYCDCIHLPHFPDFPNNFSYIIPNSLRINLQALARSFSLSGTAFLANF